MKENINIKKSWPALTVNILVVLINLLVLINAILHDSGIGYDAQAHLDYIYVMPYHLPTPEDTDEFFSAPLPYVLPSLVNLFCNEVLHISDPEPINGFAAQLINVLLSLGVTFLLLRISEILNPGNVYYKIFTLFTLASLPVYYKTFSQVRGEPYVVFFVLVLLYLFARILVNPEILNWKYGVKFGLALGLLALSRQWGFLIFPPIIGIAFLLLRKNVRLGLDYSRTISIGLIVAFFVAGWFYIFLYVRYGTVTAFNVQPKNFALSNQPLSFYRSTGLKNLTLFTSPIRPTFDNQLFPVFYSEIWGDYWGYFVFIREKAPLYDPYANALEISRYLGRVNAMSILPTVFLMVASIHALGSIILVFLQKKSDAKSIFFSLIGLILASTFLGYFWFLIKYPVPKGATIKATYVLHIFAILPFVAGELFDKLRIAAPRKFMAMSILFILIFLHNLPAMITRYWWFLKQF